MGRFNTANRQVSGIEQAELNEHRRLIPIDMLVRELAVAEVDDHDRRDFDMFVGGRNAGEHPIHRDGMSELEDELIDDAILADRA